jgi:gas vesicle protein
MTDEHRDTEQDGSNALPWFLLGLGVGAALALWFAPQSGEDTRATVRKRLQSLRDVAEEQFEDAREAVVDGLGRAVEAVAGADEDAEEDQGSHPTAREALQRRLRAARARSRRRPATPGADPEGEGSPT